MKIDVTRSIEINAPIEKVRPFIEDFNKWNSWSPWTIVEPECNVTVNGNSGEVGHEMSWDGEIIGSGVNKLIHNDEQELRYDLKFIKPFKSQAITSFQFESAGSGTKVTWTMDSSMPFFLFFMVPMMKAMIGMDYDRGLKMLKAMVEEGKINAKTTNNGTIDLQGFSYVGIQRTAHIDEMGDVMKQDFETIIADIVHDKKKSPKHWVTLYPKMDMKQMQMTYIAAVSDEALADVELGDQYVRGTIEDGRALEIKHDGAYDFLGNAWSMGMMYLRAKKLKQNGIPFEQYWNSPKEVSPEELKTSIYFPLK